MTAQAADRLPPPALEPGDVAEKMDGVLRRVTGDAGRQDAYLPSPCVQNHAANLARLANGDLACVWFGGTMEGMGDISIYMSRFSDGVWSSAVRLSDDSTRSEQNPILFTAPDGRLWLIYTSQPSGNQDQAVIKARISTDDGRSFGPVFVLFDRPGTFVRQPPLVTAAGDWLLPAFLCPSPPSGRWRGDNDSSAVLRSTDQGRSWMLHDVPESTGAVHMNILAAANGLIALYRSRFADNILISRSADGLSWTPPEPTPLPNNNASIQAARLADGRLAIVFNASSAATSSERRASLYDEIDGEIAGGEGGGVVRPAIWGVPRAPLVVALSSDDGRSFPVQRTLETGSGYCLSNNSVEGLNREFSYPSVLPAPDGSIDIAFTYYRRAIKHVRITADWIARADA